MREAQMSCVVFNTSQFICFSEIIELFAFFWTKIWLKKKCKAIIKKISFIWISANETSARRSTYRDLF